MDDVQSFEETDQSGSDGAAQLDESKHNGLAEAKTKSDDALNEYRDEEGYVRTAVPYSFGHSLDEAVEKWGEEFVFELAESLFQRKLQNKMRRQLADGVPPERVKENFSPENYDPTTTTRSGGDDVTDLMRKLNKLGEDEKAEVLEALDL